jgi:hypothetical protein
MTAQEMRDEFLILYDKITNFDAPGYTDEEISRLLTKAQERIVLTKINPLSNKYRTGFERTEKLRKDLSELVKTAELTSSDLSSNQEGVLTNGQFYDLPSDFLFAVGEYAIITHPDSCYNGTEVIIKPVVTDEYNVNRINPFKKPYQKVIWRLDVSKDIPSGSFRHELIGDGVLGINRYKLRYIKYPSPIISDTSTIDGVTGPQNSELNRILHRQIIDEAVKLASGITDPETYQIKSITKDGAE